MIFVTADLHLFHKRILCMDDEDGRLPRTRPFDDIPHMNKALIENWNNIVTDSDIIYVIGDFIGATKVKDRELTEITSQLKGYKILLKGNHDKKPILEQLFDKVYESNKVVTVEYGGIKFFMNHFLSNLRWEERHAHECFLHAHAHNRDKYNLIKTFYRVPIYDVGVDGNNYSPVSLEYIINKYRNPQNISGLIKCDCCGRIMRERSGQYGKFLGCSNYPNCGGIQNIWPKPHY